MARPRKEIDKEQFEKLCAIQCTEKEICEWFDVCEDTLNAWCKRTYKACFSDASRKKREVGKISLRRNQWRLAENNVTMAIWLGKQYLGQRDQVASDLAVTVKDDALSGSLRELARKLEGGDGT